MPEARTPRGGGVIWGVLYQKRTAVSGKPSVVQMHSFAVHSVLNGVVCQVKKVERRRLEDVNVRVRMQPVEQERREPDVATDVEQVAFGRPTAQIVDISSGLFAQHVNHLIRRVRMQRDVDECTAARWRPQSDRRDGRILNQPYGVLDSKRVRKIKKTGAIVANYKVGEASAVARRKAHRDSLILL